MNKNITRRKKVVKTKRKANRKANRKETRAKKTRKIKGGATIAQNIAGVFGMSSALKWKEKDISKVVIPHLLHGKIITREKMMLRILTVVFIQLVCIDIIAALKTIPDGTSDFPEVRKIKSFMQVSNEQNKSNAIGDTLRTRDIPHLMAFFTFPLIDQKRDNDKEKTHKTSVMERVLNIKKQLLELSMSGSFNKNMYDDDGTFKYKEIEDQIEYTMERFLNSPNTDKKFGTFGNSMGQYKAYMVNTLGIANLIDKRKGVKPSFDFKLYAKEALRDYTIKYLNDRTTNGTDNTICKIIKGIYYSLFFTYILSTLMNCSGAIILQIYTDYSLPKCNIPIQILNKIISYGTPLFKIDLTNIINAIERKSPDLVVISEKQIKQIKYSQNEINQTLISATKSKDPTRKTPIIDFAYKWACFIFNLLTGILRPSVWLKQVFVKTYYVEEQNIYSMMGLFKSFETNNELNESDVESVFSNYNNWLEPKDSIGIGNQETDLAKVNGMNHETEVAEVLRLACARAGASFTHGLTSSPLDGFFPVIGSWKCKKLDSSQANSSQANSSQANSSQANSTFNPVVNV
jgi:hypothetical protein